MDNELDLKALVGDADRTLLVCGLQALWRERVAARNAALSVAIIAGTAQPDDSMFGIEAVVAMLRRVGAGPASY